MKNTENFLRKRPNGQNKTKMEITKTKNATNTGEKVSNGFWQIGIAAVLLMFVLSILSASVVYGGRL